MQLSIRISLQGNVKHIDPVFLCMPKGGTAIVEIPKVVDRRVD
jgi:hypothetical protein